MKPKDAYLLGTALMHRWGLLKAGWSLLMDYDPEVHGWCSKEMKVIAFSYPLCVSNTKKCVTDTLLHEIAHALTASKARDHGKAWKRNAQLVGAIPTARVDKTKVRYPKVFWYGYCHCGPILKVANGKSSRPKRKFCSICKSFLQWSKFS